MAAAAEARKLYTTYGNVAYDGSAVQIPEQQEVFRPLPKERPRERVKARPKVRVREAGEVSVIGVVGFACVVMLSLMLLMTCTRMMRVYDETVTLENTLEDLREDEAALLAKQEMAYDLQAIEEQVTADGSMAKPRSSQQVMLDLSEADNVVIYERERSSVLEVLDALREHSGALLNNVLSYFD